ncbi:uncharacterized protein KY384_008503 [Bacidia gigantensis]|uniref:uncharacterized protein n=1 Tax=Bacidia gigantensis TaxID=2732470 RepID=UPI001D041014|nr:uncharacterized protein KY384_008503 [Bacidia gigantensis]KAG8527074.1 hypothetical protein KY384_008503 [Bacidia gigantensis]
MTSPEEQRLSPRVAIKKWLQNSSSKPKQVRSNAGVLNEPFYGPKSHAKNHGDRHNPHTDSITKKKSYEKLQRTSRDKAPKELSRSKPSDKYCRVNENTSPDLDALLGHFRHMQHRGESPLDLNDIGRQRKRRRKVTPSEDSTLEDAGFPVDVVNRQDRPARLKSQKLVQLEQAANYVWDGKSDSTSTAHRAEIEESAQTSSFSRRPRHKTHPDKYAVKTEKSSRKEKAKRKKPVAKMPDLAFPKLDFLNTRKRTAKEADYSRREGREKYLPKDRKRADGDAEISSYFTSRQDTIKGKSRPDLGNIIERGSSSNQKRRDPPLALVELPSNPFLGFGSCGPSSTSPVKEGTEPKKPNGLQIQKEIRSPSRSTSYFSWSRSNASRAEQRFEDDLPDSIKFHGMDDYQPELRTPTGDQDHPDHRDARSQIFDDLEVERRVATKNLSGHTKQQGETASSLSTNDKVAKLNPFGKEGQKGVSTMNENRNLQAQDSVLKAIHNQGRTSNDYQPTVHGADDETTKLSALIQRNNADDGPERTASPADVRASTHSSFRLNDHPDQSLDDLLNACKSSHTEVAKNISASQLNSRGFENKNDVWSERAPTDSVRSQGQLSAGVQERSKFDLHEEDAREPLEQQHADIADTTKEPQSKTLSVDIPLDFEDAQSQSVNTARTLKVSLESDQHHAPSSRPACFQNAWNGYGELYRRQLKEESQETTLIEGTYDRGVSRAFTDIWKSPKPKLFSRERPSLNSTLDLRRERCLTRDTPPILTGNDDDFDLMPHQQPQVWGRLSSGNPNMAGSDIFQVRYDSPDLINEGLLEDIQPIRTPCEPQSGRECIDRSEKSIPVLTAFNLAHKWPQHTSSPYVARPGLQRRWMQDSDVFDAGMQGFWTPNKLY